MSMLVSSRTDSLNARFDPYIGELRDFFASRTLPVGTPTSLIFLLDGLRDPAFHEEMVSMVRSILYREETLPRIELAEIIAVAAGGPQALDDAAESSQPMRAILAFVQEVARAKSSFATVDPSVTQDAVESLPMAEALPTGTNQTAASATARDAVSVTDPAPSTLTNDQLSRSLLHLQDSPEKLDPVPATTPLHRTGPSFAQLPERYVHQPRQTLTAVLRHSYWIPGVIVLVMAIAAGSLLRRHASAPVVVAASPLPALLSPDRAKPSAYGEPLHGPRPTPRVISVPDALTSVPSPPPPVFDSRDRASISPGSGMMPHALPPSTRSVNKAATAMSHPAITNPLALREGVFLASSGSMASHLLSAPAPGYPRLASFTHTEGQVIVQVVVGRDGKVSATRVLDGPHLLRSAAEHAIHKWRYRPYLVDGRPTDVATIVTVSFRLR